MKKIKIKNFSPLIGIVLFLYIITKTDLNKLLIVLKQVNIKLILLALVMSIITILLMNLRWTRIIQAMKIDINYSDCLPMFLKSLAIGAITPGRIGELYRAKYLKDKTKKDIGETLSSVVLDRIYDLLSLLVLSLIGVLLLTHFYITTLPVYIIILFIIILFLSLIALLNKKTANFFILPLINLIIPKKNKETSRLQYDVFFTTINKLKFYNYFEVLSITILIWFINFVRLYIIAISLNINISFWFILIISPVITVLNLVPITISGLGTLQASCIYVMGIVAVPMESAIAFSFLYTIFGIWLISLPGIFLLLFKNKSD